MSERDSPLGAGCQPCRLVGTGGSLAISGYLFWELRRIPKADLAHRVVVLTMATGFAGLAVYRWRTP